MGSFSDDKIALLSLDVTGQLTQPVDGVVERVGLGVIHVDVHHAVDVERHIQVHTARPFVGETVLVLTVCVSLDLLVAVVNVDSLYKNLS